MPDILGNGQWGRDDGIKCSECGGKTYLVDDQGHGLRAYTCEKCENSEQVQFDSYDEDDYEDDADYLHDDPFPAPESVPAIGAYADDDPETHSQTAGKDEVANIRRSIQRLDSFRTACLLGEGPKSITVDGHVFKDELEAEGYLVELSYALKDAESAAGGDDDKQ